MYTEKYASKLYTLQKGMCFPYPLLLLLVVRPHTIGVSFLKYFNIHVHAHVGYTLRAKVFKPANREEYNFF